MDFEEILGKNGLTLKLGLEITPKMLLAAWTEEDSQKYVMDEVIVPNVEKLLDDLQPILEDVVNKTVKVAAKAAVTEELKNQIIETLSTGDEEADALIEDLNVGDRVESIINAFEAEDATVDSFVDEIVSQINDAFDVLVQKGYTEFDGQQLEGETVTELKDAITEMLDSVGLIGEDGKLEDIEQAVATLMDKVAGEDKDKDGDNGEVADAAEEEEQKSLTDTVRDLIYDKIPSDIAKNVSMVGKIMGGVLAVFLLLWLWVAVLALLKTLFSKRKPIVFVGILFVIFAFIQMLLGLVLTFGVDFVMSGKLDIDAVQEVLDELNGIKISFSTSMQIGAFCVLAKHLLAFFYFPAKRHLKKELKYRKKHPLYKSAYEAAESEAAATTEQDEVKF